MFTCRAAVLERISVLLCQSDPFPSEFLIRQAVSRDKTAFFDILDHWSEFRVYSKTENGDTLMLGYPGVEEAMDKLKQELFAFGLPKGRSIPSRRTPDEEH